MSSEEKKEKEEEKADLERRVTLNDLPKGMQAGLFLRDFQQNLKAQLGAASQEYLRRQVNQRTGELSWGDQKASELSDLLWKVASLRYIGLKTTQLPSEVAENPAVIDHFNESASQFYKLSKEKIEEKLKKASPNQVEREIEKVIDQVVSSYNPEPKKKPKKVEQKAEEIPPKQKSKPAEKWKYGYDIGSVSYTHQGEFPWKADPSKEHNEGIAKNNKSYKGPFDPTMQKAGVYKHVEAHLDDINFPNWKAGARWYGPISDSSKEDHSALTLGKTIQIDFVGATKVPLYKQIVSYSGDFNKFGIEASRVAANDQREIYSQNKWSPSLHSWRFPGTSYVLPSNDNRAIENRDATHSNDNAGHGGGIQDLRRNLGKINKTLSLIDEGHSLYLNAVSK